MNLHTLVKSPGLKDKMKRLGRGNGGKGNYSGKGLKGQKARSGTSIPAYFAGGQTPLYMRLPKLKGFKRYYKLREQIQIVNLWSLVKAGYNNGDVVSKASLFEKGLIKNAEIAVKILWNGEYDLKLEFDESIEYFSKTAEKAK